MSGDFAARLDRVETALDDGNPALAFGEVVALLDYARSHLARQASPETMDGERFRRDCGRFSAAWARLVRDPRWDPLHEPRLPALLFGLPDLFSLVNLGPDGSLDRDIAAQTAAFQRERSAAGFLRWLLLWTPSATVVPPPFRHFESVRAVVTAQALASIAAIVCCDARTDAARAEAIALLASGRVTAADLAPFVDQPLFASAWMRCSYASVPGKHDIKIAMNRAIVSVVSAMPPPAHPVSAIEVPSGDRPLLVVPMEWAFGDGGAMYRCYAPVIADLRRRFRVVGMAEKRSSDAATAALCDTFVHYEDLSPSGALDVACVASAIRRLDPALVFFPSIGMLRLVIWLANMRFAPVQVMTVGHPASSRSAAIDFVVTETGFVDDPSIFSERLVRVPRGTLSFDAPAIAAPPGESVGPVADGCIHVAVPAVAHKISWAFVQTLQEVGRRARRPVRFHLFTGLAGANYLEFARRISASLPSSTIYPFQQYAEYVAQVDRCHVHAASFPFGGTNSLVDSLRQGLPVVALRGREVHERVDADFVERLGLDKELVATSPGEYAAILLRLVDDPDFLARMRAGVRASDVGSLLMRGGNPGAFTDALWGLLPPP